TDDSPLKFSNIVAIPDILNWLNNTFVPAVFVTEDPFNEPLPENEWGRIAMYNQVLGGVSFEVTQMHQHECKTAQFLRSLYGKCYDSEDTTIYDFVMPDNYTTMEARRILEEKGDWLNASTKELLITVPTLNSKIPGYVVTTLKFDFKAGGYIKPSFTTTPMLADHYPTTHTIVIDILIVLWFSPWMLMFTIVGYAMKRYKRDWQTDVFDKSAQDGIMRMIRKCIFPDDILPYHLSPRMKEHHQVVFWGRIRSKRFRDVLRAKMENSQDLQHPWTPETILTVDKLELLFPEVSDIECVNTMTYLIAGICDDHTKQDGDEVSHTAPLKMKERPEIHDLAIHLAGVEEKMENLGLDLQQKIDLLVEKMAKL
ncbi:Hypothetical protein PHPALM_19723, partial [Phytophthora palmivora]